MLNNVFKVDLKRKNAEIICNMLTSLVSIVNIEQLLNNLSNFNEIFSKNVTYVNIKRHKKTVLHKLSRKCIFGKTTWGGVKLKNGIHFKMESILNVTNLLKPTFFKESINSKICMFLVPMYPEYQDIP